MLMCRQRKNHSKSLSIKSSRLIRRRRIGLLPLVQHLSHPGEDIHPVNLIEVGRGQDFFNGTLSLLPALVEEKGAITVGSGGAKIMNDRDDSPVRLCQPVPEQIEGLLLVDQVQVIGRLIQQENSGVLGKELGQEDPLDLPARQGQDRLFEQGAQTSLVNGLLYQIFAIGLTGARKKSRGIGVAAQTDDLLH